MIDALTAPLTWPGFGEVSPLALLALCAASLLAGAVDAIVGGGGLVQLSALLIVLPGGEAIFSVATNKLASVVGTASAAVTFARRVPIDRRHAVPMAAAAFVGAIGGALLAAALPSRVLTVIVLIALIGVGLYTWRRPELGAVHAPRFPRRTQGAVMTAGGAAIGFYDGLAGPGTGSFLVFLLVGLVGFAFLQASATAKVVNTATNLGALVFFLPAGVVLLGLGAVLAVANLTGAVVGARMAVERGSAFVRRVFLVVVAVLVVTLAVPASRGLRAHSRVTGVARISRHGHGALGDRRAGTDRGQGGAATSPLSPGADAVAVASRSAERAAAFAARARHRPRARLLPRDWSTTRTSTSSTSRPRTPSTAPSRSPRCAPARRCWSRRRSR